MIWFFAILLVLICVATLFFGFRDAAAQGNDDVDAHAAFFRDRLAGIDRDLASGRLTEHEAAAARKELAREVLLNEKAQRGQASARSGNRMVFAVLPIMAVASLALYGWVGAPDLPSQPLADRDVAQPENVDLDTAISRVEAQMAQTPDDVRGWIVLAPIYMEQARFADAANALRQIIALDGATPDRQTELAVALSMANDGAATPEALQLLRQAAAEDETHIGSRFYLAGELTRKGDFDTAIPLWQEIIAMAQGQEPWLQSARAGLAAAQTGMAPASEPADPQATQQMIRDMVEGLADRLASQGGSLDEWQQLVRSRLQLDGAEAAQADLERGLAALSEDDALALNQFAADLGLVRE